MAELTDKFNLSKTLSIKKTTNIKKNQERDAFEQLRWQETLQALESVRQGKVVDADIVNAWLKCWGSSDELPTDVTLKNLMHKIYTRAIEEERN